MGTTILSANGAADRMGDNSHQPPAFEIKSVRNISCSDLGWPQVVIGDPELVSIWSVVEILFDRKSKHRHRLADTAMLTIWGHERTLLWSLVVVTAPE